MNVKYNFNGENYSYDVVNEKEEKDKVNFLLTNNKGDFVNLGVEKNVSKYQGMSICNPQNLEIFKILDEIILPGLDVKNVEYGGYYVKREYVSKLSQVVHVPVIPNEKSDFDDEAELNYDDNGVLEETYEDENEIVAEDKFYLGPSGGMIYEVFNYEGNLVFDLDIHKFNDFDEWGRNYNVYKKNGIVFVEYTKQKEDKEEYKVYFGIKSTNFVYDLLDDWVEKNYEYSKKRGSLSSRYVYRLMSIWVDQSKRLIIGSGFSEEEVFNQINLLEMHQGELEKLDNERFKDLVSNVHFREPIPQDFTIAYKLSVNGLYNFLNKGFETESVKSGSFAGYPWFSNVWARDELVGLRGFINLNDLSYVKEKIFDYLNKIDIDSGLIKRIDEEGALNSPDGVFWLAKRIEDFISKTKS